MFKGFDEKRVLNMAEQEKRWLDNIKKAFHSSDLGFQSGAPEDLCLEEMLKAIDTAKTLRRSLRGEDCSHADNKKRFIEFLCLEIPLARPGGSGFELRDRATGNLKKYTFGEIVYLIRCMVHENENLNVAEAVEYHILLDWSNRNPQYFARVENDRFICNGHFLWNRLRQVVAKFITCIDAMTAIASDQACFSITSEPGLGTIQPARKKGRPV